MIDLKTRAVAPFFPDPRTFHNIYKLQKCVLLRHQSYLIVFTGNKNLRFWQIMPLSVVLSKVYEFLYLKEIHDGRHSCTYWVRNKSVLLETTNMIESILYVNISWMALSIMHVFVLIGNEIQPPCAWLKKVGTFYLDLIFKIHLYHGTVLPEVLAWKNIVKI